MKAVIQRVKQGSVAVDGRETGRIGRGMVVLLGIGKQDGDRETEFLMNKLLTLRIFPGEKGEFDRSITDIQGEILVVSQFLNDGPVTFILES
ncbi:MAG: D-aminoacyl-tRNA deacylase [bacterium]